MTKHRRQLLKRLINTYGLFPNMFSKLNPRYESESLIIPFYGSEDSRFILSAKMAILYGPLKIPTVKKLIEKFVSLDQKDQVRIAYDVSHELKIASLAASLALNNQHSNVYEIGASIGLGSFHYSRCIKEKEIPASESIYKLIAIEINKQYIKSAKNILKLINREIISKVEFIHRNAIPYLPNSCKDEDIVFSSVAQPDVCHSILSLSDTKMINFVISYGETFDFKAFEDLINPNKYNIYPFKDRAFNIHVPTQQKRYGVYVSVKKS